MFEVKPPQFLTRDQLAFQEGAAFSLRIQTQANAVGALTLRGMTKEGPFTFRHLTVNDGSLGTSTFRIPDLPLWVTVADENTDFVQGMNYVAVHVLVNGSNIQQLFAGMVYQEKSLSWPSTNAGEMVTGMGRIRTVNGTNPAANTEIVEAVPSQFIRKLSAIRFTLVADANAATRQVHLLITDGSNTLMDVLAATTQTATQTRAYLFTAGQGTNIGGASGDIVTFFPGPILLPNGFEIQSLTDNLQATDNYGAPVSFVEDYFTPF